MSSISGLMLRAPAAKAWPSSLAQSADSAKGRSGLAQKKRHIPSWSRPLSFREYSAAEKVLGHVGLQRELIEALNDTGNLYELLRQHGAISHGIKETGGSTAIHYRVTPAVTNFP
jgi:hypothetical protein